MSRISNDLAGQIAFKLTEKSRKYSEKLHLDFREIVTKSYEDVIPNAVKELFKNHPEWVDAGKCIKLVGHGFRYEQISPTRQVITHENDNNLFEISSKSVDKINTAYRKWVKSKEKYTELKGEVKQALLNLKTFNNIRKELPAAAEFLPPPMSNALVCNFDSLNKKIKSQQDLKEETVSSS